MATDRQKPNDAKPPRMETSGGISPDFEKISEKRLQLKIPIDELCAQAGLNRSTWQRIAAGKAQPRWRTLRKLKDALKALEKDVLS